MPGLLTPARPNSAALADWLGDPAVAQAARHLAQGGLLGLPTETVYGLAADAGQPGAVRAIFEAKGRPAEHPLIVHLPPHWQPGVEHHARDVPAFARALMEAFWPGPLTLILPRRPGVAGAAAGGQNSIGLRCPAHPVAQAVLLAAHALGVHGVAAPSANRFGRVSPTTAAHVMEEFAALPADQLQVLDGGPCEVGIESAIVDATRGRPVLLRPGMLSAQDLAQACGQAVLAAHEQGGTAPKASGTLASHYAPRARVRLMPEDQLRHALDMAAHVLPPAKVAVYAPQRPPGQALVWRPMPTCAADCARQLFAVLRELDDLGVELIWVQTPPDTPDWQGVIDRLQRAAA